MRKVYNKVLQITGSVIAVPASGVGYGELALVSSPMGSALAEVIRIEGDLVHLQVSAGNRGVSTGDEIRFLGHSLRVAFSENLLGRIFDGTGKPRDAGPVLSDPPVETRGPAVNPVKRVVPSRMIHTRIPMIDLFNSLVESQKISIFTRPGEPYNELMARIALQAEVDIIVLGGMGLRYDNYLFFKTRLESSGALFKSVMFVHTAQDPVVECLNIPDLCLAVAEKFALSGKRVLVLLTDMAGFCDALKEISVSMEQVPSNRGYPGDLYSRLSERYEKAVDFSDAGSITVLSVTTMPGNDVTHPVPDNTGYITEGQYYLNNGKIEPFGSLSRLKQLVNKDTRRDHRSLMDAMIRLYAYFQAALEKKAMGFRMSAWDEKLLKYGRLFEEGLMDLDVNIPLFDALDRGWEILANCFLPDETGIRSDLIAGFWPENFSRGKERGPDAGNQAHKD
jgi:V/A-type H+/Na+-transporting ATPase subunit B